jgi:hypothetical protein
MSEDGKVSIEDMLKKIGFMSIQLDVAAESIRTLQAEITRLNSVEVISDDIKEDNSGTEKQK